MSKLLVLSVGGSLIVTKQGINLQFLREFRKFILRQVKLGDRFILVVGGGMTARSYIKAANKIKRIGAVNSDYLGIAATKLNAQLLQVIFDPVANKKIITDSNEKIKSDKKIIIAAGDKPGCSSDYDAVLIAKNHQINTVINLSNIDYVYDRDPNKFSKAKKLTDLNWSDFRKIVGNKWQPGLNMPFDPIASRLASEKRLKLIILNGAKLKNLEKCLLGDKFKGTIIT